MTSIFKVTFNRLNSDSRAVKPCSGLTIPTAVDGSVLIRDTDLSLAIQYGNGFKTIECIGPLVNQKYFDVSYLETFGWEPSRKYGGFCK